MPKEHPKMYEKVVNMAPTWAQVGAMLGSKIVLDTSKSDTEKNIKKQKPVKEWNGKRVSVWSFSLHVV